jgi:hypothetical protein
VGICCADHPLWTKIDTIFADKRRSLGRYNSLADYRSRSLFLFLYCKLKLFCIWYISWAVPKTWLGLLPDLLDTDPLESFYTDPKTLTKCGRFTFPTINIATWFFTARNKEIRSLISSFSIISLLYLSSVLIFPIAGYILPLSLGLFLSVWGKKFIINTNNGQYLYLKV